MHTNDEVHGPIVVTYATPYLLSFYSFLLFGTRFLDHTFSLFLYFFSLRVILTSVGNKCNLTT